MMHDLCSSYLYVDILVGNANTLVQDLDGKCPKAKLLNRVKTLRLHHPVQPASDHPSYADLHEYGDWHSGNISRWPNDHRAMAQRLAADRGIADDFWLRPAGLTLNEQVTTGDMKVNRRSQELGYGDKNLPLLKDQAFANLT
jgi:hypothetical protein